MAETHPTHTQHNPGEVWGIVGFALAFSGGQIVGLIFSIIGYRRSRAVGIQNRLAIAGIIINSIFLLLFFIIMILYVGLIIYAVSTGSYKY